MQAEAGYYLASLMGAISFIENLEASSLSVSPEEFDKQIEKTMNELSQEKAEAIAAEAAAKLAAATAAASVSSVRSTQSPEPGTGHKKHESKLATLLAGTSGSRANRQRPPLDEKQFLQQQVARSPHQQPQSQQQFHEKSPSLIPQQIPHHSSRSGPESSSSNLSYRNASPSLSNSSGGGTGSSIMNPAAALIERGANFASKTIQKPLDLIERIFLDSSGDEEEMAKPYPPRVAAVPSVSGIPPPLPQRTSNPRVQQQQSHQQRPDGPGREDSFTEFVYVPPGEQVHQPSPQQFQQHQPPFQPTFYQQEQLQQQQYPGYLHHQQQQQQQYQQQHRERTQSGGQPLPPVPGAAAPQQQQQQTMEGYLQALETLTDMFPSCEREVCDVILQANDGRLSPSIDTLLEISSASDVGGQQLPLESPPPPQQQRQQGPDLMGHDDVEVPVSKPLDLSPVEQQKHS